MARLRGNVTQFRQMISVFGTRYVIPAVRSTRITLHKIRRLGAPVASIGGAGTFDGVFLTGIVAVLLAAMF